MSTARGTSSSAFWSSDAFFMNGHWKILESIWPAVPGNYLQSKFREVGEALNRLVDEFATTLGKVHALVDRTAAVTRDNPLHRGQSHTSSGKFAGAVQALKHTKQFIGVLHVETRAVIANKQNPFTVSVLHPELNLCGRLFRGELPGIPDQVFQRDSQ